MAAVAVAAVAVAAVAVAAVMAAVAVVVAVEVAVVMVARVVMVLVVDQEIILMKATPRHNSDGIALIMVMCAIVVLSILAAAFAYSMKVETRLAQNADSEEQFLWLGRSGVECACWILSQQPTGRTLRFAEPKMGRWIRQPGRIQQRVVVRLAR